MFLSRVYVICMLWCSVVLVAHATTRTVTVDTEYGRVRGHVVPTFNGAAAANVNVFNSVPFARSAAGNLRFRAPQKPDSWQDEFVADKIGPACPQRSCCFLHYSHLGWSDIREDCLNVNIYAPSDQRNAPLAVMVWFHGGTFLSGANFQYPGHFLATHDVVVVTANYRLNNFGFAYTGDDSSDSNAGMLDQVMALQFVKDNIAGFGGDPERVTIFGESAGAVSVGLHTVSPKSRGLFKQAITESGNEFNSFAVVPPGPALVANTQRIAAQVQCPTSPNDSMMYCLRGKSMDEIIRAACLCYNAPTVDGPGGFLPDYPTQLVEENGVSESALMTGINMDEGGLLLLPMMPAPTGDGYNRTEFEQYLNRFMLLLGLNSDDYVYEHTREAINYNYSPWPHINNGPNNTQAMIDMGTDAFFAAPWDHQAKVHSAAGVPTYSWVFDFRSDNSPRREWMGVPHSAELPYIWGYPMLKLNPEVREDSGIRFDVVNWTLEDMLVSLYWQTLFTNFAKYGDPTPEPVDAPLGGAPTTWIPFTLDALNYLYGSAQPHMDKDFSQTDFAFWTQYLPTIAGYNPFHAEQSSNFPTEEMIRLLAEDYDKDWRTIVDSFQLDNSQA